MYKLMGSEEVSNDLRANLKVTRAEFECPGPVWEKVTVTGMTEGGQQGPGTAQGHSCGGPGGCQVEKATAARCLPPRQTGQRKARLMLRPGPPGRPARGSVSSAPAGELRDCTALLAAGGGCSPPPREGAGPGLGLPEAAAAPEPLIRVGKKEPGSKSGSFSAGLRSSAPNSLGDGRLRALKPPGC